MPGRFSIASVVAVLVLLSAVLAQEEAAARPPAREKGEQRVALSYETAKDPQHLPVRAVGFYLSLGRRFKLEQVEGSQVCEAKLTYADHPFRFRVEECHSASPELRLDRTGDTDWQEAGRLSEGSFLHRQEGYLQAMLPPLNEALADRKLRLICITREGREPYAFLGDRGIWSGTLPVGNGRLKLSVYDSDADGDLYNDDLMVDVDGDGKITRVERVRNGETILLGEHAITLRITREPRWAVTARIAPRSGSEGRDILGELGRAPVVGNAMPAFEFRDQRGKLVSSRALRGKVLLVNFWGVW